MVSWLVAETSPSPHRVSHRVSHRESHRESHRGVHQGGQDFAMHAPRRIQMLLGGLQRKTGLPVLRLFIPHTE